MEQLPGAVLSAKHLQAVTKLTSREFNRDTARAKKAARSGPVFITDRGRPAHVLLTIESFQELTGQRGDIVELLGQPDGVAFATLDPPRSRELVRAADLS